MDNDISQHAEEYLRCLNGENIMMNFTDASAGSKELIAKGLAWEYVVYRRKRNMIAMTDTGRVLAKQIKREANGRMP